MFAKVHSSKDVKSGNKGSCIQLVNYLSKEGNNAFFSHSGDAVSDADVILSIDNNKKSIGKDEAKFYMLSLNPSQEELKHLAGRDINHYSELTEEERMSLNDKLQNYTRTAMDAYARNFGRTKIETGSDLMYFARIETERTYKYSDENVKNGIAKIGDEKPGLNLHVHIIISRKSADGTVKLSPDVKSTGNEWMLGDRVVKRGFSHENWKVATQEAFNNMFNYSSNSTETYKPQQQQQPVSYNNKDLQDIYDNYSLTSVTQVAELMKERGYKHYFKYGQCFEKDNEVVRVQTKDLQHCVKPLSDDTYKDIISRFNIYEYDKNREEYNQNEIHTQKISFETNNKNVNSFVLIDERTKSVVSVHNLVQYGLQNDVQLLEQSKYIESLDNEDLKNIFENTKVKTIDDVSKEMENKNYELHVETAITYTFVGSNFRTTKIDDKTLQNTDIRECLEDKKIKTMDDVILRMNEKGYGSIQKDNMEYLFIDGKKNIFVLSAKAIENECLRASLRNNGSIDDVIKTMQNTYKSNFSQKENVTYHYINKENKSAVSINEKQFQHFYGRSKNGKTKSVSNQSITSIKGLIGGQLMSQMSKSDEGRILSKSYSNMANNIKYLSKGNFKKLVSHNLNMGKNKVIGSSQEAMAGVRTVRIVRSTYKSATKAVNSFKSAGKGTIRTGKAAVNAVKTVVYTSKGVTKLIIGILNPLVLPSAITDFVQAGKSAVETVKNAALATKDFAHSVKEGADVGKELSHITENMSVK